MAGGPGGGTKSPSSPVKIFNIGVNEVIHFKVFMNGYYNKDIIMM